MPYHVMIPIGADVQVYPDFELTTVVEDIAKNYAKGVSISLGSYIYAPEAMQHFRVFFTDETTSDALGIRPSTKDILAFVESGRDATNEVLFRATGFKKYQDATTVETTTVETTTIGTMTIETTTIETSTTDARAVFVVHGRNSAAREAMFAFLTALDLKPMEWDQVVSDLGRGAPYVGEVLDQAFRSAAAILVLMTGDDIARLSPEFVKPADAPYETQLTPQARPNVIFEAGMAFGHNPEQTVIVQIGNLRPFSDVGGRLFVEFDGSPQSRHRLAERLAAVGCKVDTSGSRWLTAGEFISPAVSSTAISTPQPVVTAERHDKFIASASWVFRTLLDERAYGELGDAEVSAYNAVVLEAKRIFPDNGILSALGILAEDTVGYVLQKHAMNLKAFIETEIARPLD